MRLLVIPLVLGSTLAAAAQQPRQPQRSVPPRTSQAKSTPSEPTLAETAAWFVRQLPAFGTFFVHEYSASRVSPGDTIVIETQYSLTGVTLDSCLLRYTTSIKVADTPQEDYAYRIPLVSTDLLLLTADSAWTLPRTRQEPRVWSVRIKAIPDAGNAFSYRHPPSDSIEEPADVGGLEFSNAESAQRVARALQHAATLCGAKRSPF